MMNELGICIFIYRNFLFLWQKWQKNKSNYWWYVTTAAHSQLNTHNRVSYFWAPISFQNQWEGAWYFFFRFKPFFWNKTLILPTTGEISGVVLGRQDILYGAWVRGPGRVRACRGSVSATRHRHVGGCNRRTAATAALRWRLPPATLQDASWGINTYL